MARVLFIAPHPDDIEYYMGGTAARHCADGDECYYAVLSRGERGTPPWKTGGEWLQTVRTEEARRGAEILGMTDMRHYRVPDGDFVQHQDTVREALTQAWRTFPADIVYMPEFDYSFYKHPDHLTTGRIAHDILSAAPSPPVMRLYHTLKPTAIYSVKPYNDVKTRAIQQHASQFWVVFPIKVMFYIVLSPLVLYYAARAGSFAFEFYRELGSNDSA